MQLHYVHIKSVLTLVPKRGVTFFPSTLQCIFALPTLDATFPYTRLPLNKYFFGPSLPCFHQFCLIIIKFISFGFIFKREKIFLLYIFWVKEKHISSTYKIEILKYIFKFNNFVSKKIITTELPCDFGCDCKFQSLHGI